MARPPRYTVLYFTATAAPTEAEYDDARQYGPHVMFRNATFAGPGTGTEPCSAVAGKVPEHYLEQFPEAVSYADWLDGKLPTPPVSHVSMTPAEAVDIAMKAPRFLTEAPALDAPGMKPLAPFADAPSGLELPPPPPAPEGAPPPAAAAPTGKGSARQRAAAAAGDPRWNPPAGDNPPPAA